jgi:hypothetical protein
MVSMLSSSLCFFPYLSFKVDLVLGKCVEILRGIVVNVLLCTVVNTRG